jgi:regulator of replication initiation timing
MELKNQILKALGLNKEEISLEFQAKLIDGTIIVSSADELAAGADVSILAEDGTTMALPIGSYEIDDENNTGFSVEEEGIVAEIYEAETEEEEEEVAPEEEVEAAIEEVVDPTEVDRLPKKIKTTEEVEFNKEALIEEIGVVIKELLTEVRNDVSRLSSELEEMKGTNESLEIEKETLSAQLDEVSKEPAAEPVTTNKFSNNNKKEITSTEYRNMSRQEKYWYNINNN